MTVKLVHDKDGWTATTEASGTMVVAIGATATLALESMARSLMEMGY
jgi:hypothetical protein